MCFFIAAPVDRSRQTRKMWMVAAYFVAWSCSCIPNPVDLHATTPSPTPSTARHFRPAIAFAHLYTMNRLLGLPPRDRPHPRKAELTAPCPEGYVPLHHLCEKCRLLVQDLKKCAFKRKWWLYEHGDTADDLIARAETCHFCAMILLDFQLNSSTNSHAPQKLTRVFIFKAPQHPRLHTIVWRRSPISND
jgi:hypothetical protein